MKLRSTTLMALMLGTAGTPAFAQDEAAARDAAINAQQQQRIDDGLKSGALSSEEAARLEKQQSHIEQQEQRDLKNGTLTSAEQARIHQQQEQASKDIHEYKNDEVHGNPQARSSQRLQADIQRNADQQQRISSGLQSGALNDKEAGSLEHGQAYSNRLEEHAAANGHVNAHQQAEIGRAETRQSRNIHAKKQGGAR